MLGSYVVWVVVSGVRVNPQGGQNPVGPFIIVDLIDAIVWFLWSYFGPIISNEA